MKENESDLNFKQVSLVPCSMMQQLLKSQDRLFFNQLQLQLTI